MSPEAKERCRVASSKSLAKIRASQTPEERSAHAKLARSKVNSAASVRKQWATIKSDPERLEKLRKQRGETSKARWDSMAPDDKVALFERIFANKTGRSKASEKFVEALIRAGIPLEAEQGVQGFIVDGLIRDQKLIIEFYGEVFHCNPKKFTDPNQYCSWISRTVGEQWARDRKRLAVFYRHGYRVVVVWESDWYSNPEKEIGRIKDAMCQSGEDRAQIGSVRS